MNLETKSFHVIVTGTDPSSRKGGIGFALPGYLAALESAEISYESIPTYNPNSVFGKYLLFLKRLPKIVKSIVRSKQNYTDCILYSHAGSDVSLFREGIVTLVARLAGAWTVMQIHSPETIAYLNSPIKKQLYKLALVGVHHLFVLTPWWKTTYQQLGIKKPLDVISNPLPLAWESIARDSTLNRHNDSTMKVLVMARIVLGKGADLVVESVPFIKDEVNINIAGTGKLLETLKNRVKQLKQQDKVSFLGWVAGEDKQKLIDESDILCHPTQMDAMPMNILEAMANGLTIVALNWGPIPDLVPANKAGILVDGADPEKIASAIDSLQSAEIREKMGNAARQWVLDNFTAKKIGQDLKNTFSEIVNK